MRVGMEGPLQHDLAEQAVEQAAGQLGAHVSGHAGVDRGQRPPVEALHHQHQPGAQRLVGHRNGDAAAAAAARRGGHRGHVARFYPQVEFLAQGAGESGGKPGSADSPAPVCAALQPGRQPPGDVQVPVHDLADIGTAHLDHHAGPGGKSHRPRTPARSAR